MTSRVATHTREDGDGVSLITTGGDGSSAGLTGPAAIKLDLLDEDPVERSTCWLFARERGAASARRPFQDISLQSMPSE